MEDALIDGLARAFAQIAQGEEDLSDEQVEEIIYREAQNSLDRACAIIIERLWDELDPDVQALVEVYWKEDGFRRGIKALLLNNFNPSGRFLIDAVLTVKCHMKEEGPEVPDRLLWRRVAEKLNFPMGSADFLKHRYHRLMKRLNAWIPALARQYARDPSGFKPYREAERLLAGDPELTPEREVER